MGALPVNTARRLGRVAVAAFLLAGGAIAFFPFFLMLVTSFRPLQDMFQFTASLLPRRVTLDNYREVFRHTTLLRYLFNGLIVTAGILFGQLLLTVPAAYAFARLSFPGRQVLFGLVLAALVFPRYIAAVPNFLLLSSLRLINSYPALILPFVGSPFGIFLLRQFFRQIPGEYFDAARIDGCNLSQMLRLVLLPLIRPALGAFSIFSIVNHWNDFFWPLVVVQTSRMLTPPAGIVYFADVEAGTRWTVVMAAAVVIIAPLVAAFLVARRQFISSLTQIALKG